MGAKRFWMVNGDGPSSTRHETLLSAEREAERLARLNPRVSFYVLEAVSMHLRIDVERVDLRDDSPFDGRPF